MIVVLLWVFGLYLALNGLLYITLIGKPRRRVTLGHALFNLLFGIAIAAIMISAANTIGALQ